MEAPIKTSARRRLDGTVVSAKMQKTVVVKVDRMKTHPKYRKQFVVSARYKAHDEKGIAKEGDEVTIEETRPLSKDKRWRILGVRKAATV